MTVTFGINVLSRHYRSGNDMKMLAIWVLVVLIQGILMKSSTAQDHVTLDCLSDLDCQQVLANSTCVENDQGVNKTASCRCIPTHNYQSGECVRKKIGDPCQNNTDCSDVIAHAHCPSKVGKCRCRVGYLKNGESTCQALEIGSPCAFNGQCDSVLDNSRCFRDADGHRTCACAKGYVLETRDNNDDDDENKSDDENDRSNNASRSHCVKPRLGSNCTSPDVDCSLVGNHVTCRLGECGCDSGYHVLEGGGGANNSDPCGVIPLYGKCSNPNDCDHLNAVCVNNIDNTPTCVCDAHHREEPETASCIPRLLHTACDSVENCPTTENVICDFNTGHCDCQKPFMPSGDGVGCYFNYLGNVCQLKQDCDLFVPNSECSADKNVCICQDVLVPSHNNTRCVVPIINTASCTDDSECQGRVANSYCRGSDNTCRCQIGFRATDDLNHCTEKNLLDACISDNDCTTKNPFSECAGIPPTCQCVSGYILQESDDDKDICRRRVLGRHACQRPSDCVDAVANSTCVPCGDLDAGHPFCNAVCDTDRQNCTKQTCHCQMGFYSTLGGTSCQRRKLWDDCSVEEDCSTSVANSNCVKGQRCLCRTGFKSLGREACEKRTLNDSCRQDEDCHVAIADSVCHKNQTGPMGSTGSRLHDNSQDGGDDDVVDGLDIHDFGTCTCRSGYKTIDGRVCQRRQIGDTSCVQHSDCEDAVAGSMCSKGMCVCRLGYSPGFDLFSCTSRTLHGPYCSSDRDCSGVIPNSECSNSDHTCVCQTGYKLESEEECVRFKLGDAGCRRDLDCADAVNDSVCSSSGSGGNGGSVSICACATGFHPDFVLEEACVPMNVSGHACDENEECSRSVANSYCSDRQCACLSGFYPAEGGTLCLKRKIGDVCDVTSDCADVIKNSICPPEGVCRCGPDFEPGSGLESCFLKPQEIGSPCFYNGHCQAIDASSQCVMADGDVIKTCVCPDGSFVGVSNRECVKLPSKIGQRCRHAAQCTSKVVNSLCSHSNGTCLCQDGYLEDDKGRTCTAIPERLGDRCLNHRNCSQAVPRSECSRENQTCACEYGYRQNTSKECLERTRIKPHKEFPTPRPPPLCNNSCEHHPNSICVKTVQIFTSRCQCQNRFASATDKHRCIPVQTYLYRVQLTREAGTYDFRPLIYKNQFKSSKLAASNKFARRVIYNGMKNIILGTPLKLRYVSSEVLNFKPLEESTPQKGVEANILIHLEATHKYYRATSATDINKFIIKQLEKSKHVLGESNLLVGSPLTRASVVTDFNECDHPDYNDCHARSTCVNTLGSFMCFCLSDHTDISSVHGKRTGRVCKVPETKEQDSSLCSTADCTTRWEFVGLVLTLVFLIVIAFIVYEIIQRKQSFNARKLYERFGTTRIRRLKLTTAGLKRLQERKKYRKKYKKRMKKEMKKNKKKKKRKFGKGGKGSGTEDSDGERSVPTTPHVLDTEEMAPDSITEIIHTPSIPIIVDDDDNDDDDHDDDDDDDDDAIVVVVSDGNGGAGGSRDPAVPVTTHSHPTSIPDECVSVFIDE